MLSKAILTKLESGDVKRLNYLSRLYARPISYLTQKATHAYLDLQAKKLKFQEDAKSAMTNLNKTGLHCDHNEISIWLKSLADGKTVESPKCHK